MDDNEDEPDDVRNATPVANDVEKGGKDETAGNPKATEKKKGAESQWCDRNARRPVPAKSEADCCRGRAQKASRTSNVMSVMVYSPPCNLPRLEIIPRHSLSKQEYINMLAIPSRRCPMSCLGKAVVRKIRPISGRINELAQPARRLIVGTLQERGESLPPEMISSLIKSIEGSACMSPEQAEQYFRVKNVKRLKDRKCGKDGKRKCKGKSKAECPSTLDKEAVMCQYLMAERFVKSILQWKCPIPVDEFKDIASIILRRLSYVLDYVPDDQGDLKSQQMRFLADIIACWISGVLLEVAEEHRDEFEQEQNAEIEDDEEEDEEDEDQMQEPKSEPKEESEDDDDEIGEVNKKESPETIDVVDDGVVVKQERLDDDATTAEVTDEEKIEAEEEARLAEERAREESEERARLEAEEQKKKAEEEAAQKEAQANLEEERSKRLAEEEEADNKRREEAEERRKKEDEEDEERRRKKLQEEEEEDERRRKKRQEEDDEDNKRRQEAEDRRKKAEAEEEAERERKEAEAKKKKEEEERLKQTGPKIAIDGIGEGELFKTDLPFVTFGKILDTVYDMLEDVPEGDETDMVHNRIQRAVYEKLSRVTALEGPDSLTENMKDVIDVLAGKAATWVQRVLKDSELKFVSDHPPEVESREIRDWGKWIDQVANRAGDWAGWIHRVVDDAEKKSTGSVNRGDWQNWTNDTETDALLWRRYYLETVHQAHHNKMMLADRPVVKTGQKTAYSPIEEEINNTDLAA